MCSKASRAASIGEGSAAGMAGALIDAGTDYPITCSNGAKGARGGAAPVSGSGAADTGGALGGSGAAEQEAHLHLLLQPMDEALGEGGIVVRGPEGIPPL